MNLYGGYNITKKRLKNGGEIMGPNYKRMIVISAAIIFVLVIASVFMNFVHIYGDEYQIPALCQADGGIYKTCMLCSKEVCIQKIPPTGHNGIWVTREEPTASAFGERELRCSVCKQQLEIIKLPPSQSIFPSLYLRGSGEGMTHLNNIVVDYEFVHDMKGIQSKGNTNIRLMNATTNYNIKHSYVLTNFNTNIGNNPFGNYDDLREIHLFSDRDDNTRSRSIVCETQWMDIVSDMHPEYYSYLEFGENSKYMGEKLLLYLNTLNREYIYAGTFTFRVPYQEFAKNLSEGKVKSVIYQSKNEDGYYYKNVYGLEDEEKYLSSLNQFLSSKGNSLRKFTDIQLLIDYCAYTFLVSDYEAYDTLYWILSENNIWYPVLCGNEHTYGCSAGRTTLIDYNKTPILDGFFKTFFSEYSNTIFDRAEEFASGRLSIDNVKNDYENIISKLSEDVYESEAKVYKVPFTSPSHELSNILEWYEKRIDYINKLKEEGADFYEEN